MVVAGDFFNSNCCFDYGNMERNSRDNGEGTMEAVYFGKCTIWNKGDGKVRGSWAISRTASGPATRAPTRTTADHHLEVRHGLGEG